MEVFQNSIAFYELKRLRALRSQFHHETKLLLVAHNSVQFGVR